MLSERELRQLLYCVSAEHRARVAGKQPGPQPWLRNLLRRLELEVALSSTRQEGECSKSDSDHGAWIGSRLTAHILGWELRTVQRHADDLDGQKAAGGRWIFPEQAVRDYAEALRHA